MGVSIDWQELFSIYIACYLWGPSWSCKHICRWCNNLPVVSIINSKRSKSPRIMDLVRAITILTLEHNFSFTATHIPGLDNSIADSLSRFQMDHYHHLAPNASTSPCAINLAASVSRYLGASLAPATKCSYSFGQNHSISVCLVQGLISPSTSLLPASEITLIYFVSHLAKPFPTIPLSGDLVTYFGGLGRKILTPYPTTARGLIFEFNVAEARLDVVGSTWMFTQ